MYIRFQHEDGVGIFQNGDKGILQMFGGLFEVLGSITRTPTWHNGCVEGHSCRGVDYDLGLAMVADSKMVFAWQYDFFLRVVSGELTEEESETIHYKQDVQYLTTEELRRSFIETLTENGVSIYLIEGVPEHETEQQAVFRMDQMDIFDELSPDDEMLLSAEAEIFY